MAYGSYYPTSYYPNQYFGNIQPAQQQNQPAASGNITWVQGEAAAKSFPVGSGQSVLLMDSEDSTFYIKSTDQSGMPQPLRVFDYKERTGQHQESAIARETSGDFVTRSEFEAFQNDIRKTIKDIRKPEAYQEGEG